jgi:RNA polymerase sigma-70 factor (ECF subfamily)
VALDEKDASRSQLMERAQGGDRGAFQTLFQDVGPLITRFLRRRMSDNSEVEDICQEVMIAVYRSRHTFQPQRPFEPWLFAIVRKVSGEHFRPEISSESGLANDLELREALQQLSPAQMEALGLTKVMGLSVEEAARRTGTSVGSMKVRVHRAYESLKKLLLQ